jgi:thiol:disulfide interchange protein DsbG
MKRTILVLAAACATAAGQGHANETLPAPLEFAVRSGNVQVTKSFDAGSGLKGWAVTGPDGPTIVYTTADGKALLVGQMFGPDGVNMTREHAQQHLPQPDYLAAFARLEKATYVVEGPRDKPKAVLYAFMDPNCPYCYLAHRALAPYVKAGLQIRWVQVAILGPTSTTRAAAILQAQDPSEALARHEQTYNPAKPGSGIAPAETVTDRTRAILAEGLALMREFGFRGTPGFVWRDADGQIRTRSGMMNLSEIPSMTGMPFIPNEDAELARFR